MARRTHPPKPPVTHYVPWDAPGGRTVAALCGAQIRRADHTNDPTCPICAKRQADYEALALTNPR